VPDSFAGQPVRQWVSGVSLQRAGSPGSSPGGGLVRPVVSKTSISVQVEPLLVWNHHDDETADEPDVDPCKIKVDFFPCHLVLAGQGDPLTRLQTVCSAARGIMGLALWRWRYRCHPGLSMDCDPGTAGGCASYVGTFPLLFRDMLPK